MAGTFFHDVQLGVIPTVGTFFNGVQLGALPPITISSWGRSWSFGADVDGWTWVNQAVPGTGLGADPATSGTWAAGELRFTYAAGWGQGRWNWIPPAGMVLTGLTGATLTGNWLYGANQFDAMYIVYTDTSVDSGDPTATVAVGNNNKEISYLAWNMIAYQKTNLPLYDVQAAGFKLEINNGTFFNGVAFA